MKQEEQIRELQLLEQNLQNFLIQKQTFQQQLIETENAISEIKKAKDKVYKIIGATIVESSKKELQIELEERLNLLNLRIKSLEKQETQIKEKAEKTQQEVLKSMQSGKS